MVYTNAAIFASEVISTCFAIYVGESIIANELLPATKGRAMGWGFVALGFGKDTWIGVCMRMAFIITPAIFTSISQFSLSFNRLCIWFW